MLINATLPCYNPSLAMTYYALRANDKKGQGWVNLPVSSITKLTGISTYTLKEHLKQMESLKWVQKFSFTKDLVYVKYVSEKKIVQTMCRNNVVFPQTNTRYVENKKNLSNKNNFLAKALLAIQLRLQREAETKLNYSMSQNKVDLKDHVNQQLVRMVEKERNARLLNRRSSHCADIFNKKQAVFINLKNHLHLGSVRIDRLKVYSIGISQKLLSKITGYSVSRISKLLSIFSDKRIRCYRRATTSETFNRNIATIDLATDTSYESIKPLPYYYKDTISHYHYRSQIRAKNAPCQLSPQELEVAKLSAITMGLPYSTAGAYKAIEKTTVRKFKKNTRGLRTPY